MTDPTMRAALEKAGQAMCICDGECFETRHGMMHGPCEQRVGKTAAAIAAFLRRIDSITLAQIVANAAEAHRATKPTIGAALAAAVEEAAKEAGDA